MYNHLGNGGSWFDLSSFGENEDEEGDYNRGEHPPDHVRDLPPPSRPPEIQPSPPVHTEKRAARSGVIGTLKPNRSSDLIDSLVASVVGSDLRAQRPASLFVFSSSLEEINYFLKNKGKARRQIYPRP